tara:strand:- start:2242 stop:2568 length:327 start_codon:yes stop_codon:yes gene_type:complete
VFRRRRRIPTGLVVRQLLAVLLMLSGGIGVVVLLQRLPEQVDVVLLVSEAIADLIRGIQQLLEALLGLAAVVLIGALVVLASVLILGAVWRLLRLLRLMLSPPDQGRR